MWRMDPGCAIEDKKNNWVVGLVSANDDENLDKMFVYLESRL